MKRMMLAAALAFSAAGPVLAADLPPPSLPPPQAPAVYKAPEEAFNWGGFYVGINGGYGFGNSNWNSVTGFPTSTGNFNISGGLVGGTIGANYQTGQVVFGVEADGDWSDIKGSSSSGSCVGATCQTSNDWLATFRGRLGYAFQRVLLYGTAGGAAGDVKATWTGGATSVSTSNTEFGWAAGAGVEFALTHNITAKAEYLFVDLSNGSISCPAGTCAGASASTIPVQFDASLIRAGLNYKFDGF
jgi:outer membrane immunogenic protein